MGTQVSFPGLGLEFTIRHIAFSIGNFNIYWYGVIIGLGLALAMLFVFSKTKEFGIDTDRFLDVVIIGAVAGVIGARLYYVAFSPSEFTSFWQIFNLRTGGLGFYGGVIFGVGSAVLTCRWRKIKLYPAMDLAAYGFLIGQGIGRWGNFVNQEAFGTNTTLPWGMISNETTLYLSRQASKLAQEGIIVDPYAPVHPTFLYESLWCALGFVLLLLYMKHRKFDGEIFLMYIAWNGFGRAFIEGLRTDSLYLFGSNLRVSQVLAILGALAAIVIIGVVRKKISDSEDENYLKPYGMTPAAQEELAAIAAERELAAKEKLEKKALADTETDEQKKEDKAEEKKEKTSKSAEKSDKADGKEKKTDEKKTSAGKKTESKAAAAEKTTAAKKDSDGTKPAAKTKAADAGKDTDSKKAATTKKDGDKKTEPAKKAAADKKTDDGKKKSAETKKETDKADNKKKEE